MTDVSTTTDIPAVQANFRLPTFSSVDSAIWFKRAEVQFRLKKVSSTTVQADYVLAAFPDSLFPQVAEWLDAKGTDPVTYDDLKAFLLKKFTLSPEQRARNILALINQPLGDQRPSQALAELRALARLPPTATGAAQTIDVLLALWLTRLPEKVRASIIDFTSFSSDDEILPRPTPSLTPFMPPPNPPSSLLLPTTTTTQCQTTPPLPAQLLPFNLVASNLSSLQVRGRHLNLPLVLHSPRPNPTRPPSGNLPSCATTTPDSVPKQKSVNLLVPGPVS